MAMVEIWTYRETDWPTRNLMGFSVEAIDGSIGKVDEASNDVGAAYLVVDTGPWIFGKKVMLPAGLIRACRCGRKDHLCPPHEGRDQERPRVQGEWLPRGRLPQPDRRLLRPRGHGVPQQPIAARVCRTDGERQGTRGQTRRPLAPFSWRRSRR